MKKQLYRVELTTTVPIYVLATDATDASKVAIENACEEHRNAGRSWDTNRIRQIYRVSDITERQWLKSTPWGSPHDISCRDILLNEED